MFSALATATEIVDMKEKNRQAVGILVFDVAIPLVTQKMDPEETGPLVHSCVSKILVSDVCSRDGGRRPGQYSRLLVNRCIIEPD